MSYDTHVDLRKGGTQGRFNSVPPYNLFSPYSPITLKNRYTEHKGDECKELCSLFCGLEVMGEKAVGPGDERRGDGAHSSTAGLRQDLDFGLWVV